MEEKATNYLDLKGDETEALLNHETSKIPLIQVTKLPSDFKGYPKGTQISFQPITLGELESLNTDKEMDFNRGIAMLLDSIHCTTLPAEELYYWDVLYIGIQRKLLAFGDTRGILRKRCPNCGKIVEKSFLYTEIEFKQMEAPNLPMKIEISGTPIEFYPITMKDFLLIETDDGEKGVFARMMKNLPYEEAIKIAENAYGVDIKKLRFVDDKLNYGMKPFVVTCDGMVKDENPVSETKGKMIPCKEQVIVEVRSPFEVVFPENEFGEDIDFEVQYG